MAIGKRIRFFRIRKGLTQKQLGEDLGFKGSTSDVRMAQYESESRIPKQDLVKEMAARFNVRPEAINVPDIDTYIGLIHTLFAIEDIYGLKIREVDGLPMLAFDKFITTPGSTLDDAFNAWMEQAKKLSDGTITKEEYDDWRYNYPSSDKSHRWVKVPQFM